MYIFAKYRERRSMFVETEKNGDLLTKYTNGCNDYGRSNNTSARMLDCGCSCKRYIRIMNLLTRLSKLCFACTYINIIFFFFLRTSRILRRVYVVTFRITSIFFLFFFFLQRCIHPLQRIRTSRDLQRARSVYQRGGIAVTRHVMHRCLDTINCPKDRRP